MVESAGLENQLGGNSYEGSNPSLSAILCNKINNLQGFESGKIHGNSNNCGDILVFPVYVGTSS